MKLTFKSLISSITTSSATANDICRNKQVTLSSIITSMVNKVKYKAKFRGQIK